jgi:WD40 repeat protein
MTSPSGSPRYKAFISYSHAADGKLAPALQVGLERFAKPWYRRRVFRVFRDKTGLAVTPKLWGSIQRAIESSEYFVLLASPAAAQSKWVQQEVAFWLEHRAPEKLLIVLTDGVIAWDHTANDFDWTRTDALPRVLERQSAAQPNHLDLRWARVDTDLSLRRPRFLDAIAGLAATLRQVPLDDLIGEDVAHYRTTRRLLRGGVALLVMLTAFAFYTAYLANRAVNMAEGLEAERSRAVAEELQEARLAAAKAESERRSLEEREQSVASSRRAAAAALSVFAQDRELSTLLAMEAIRISPTSEADTALRTALAGQIAPVVFRGPDSPVTSVVFSGSSPERLLAVFEDGSARIWTIGPSLAPPAGRGPSPVGRRVSAGAELGRGLSGPAGLVLAAKAISYDGADGVQARFSPDGASVLTATFRTERSFHEPEGGRAAARIWDAATGKLRHELKHPYLQHAAFSPDGRRVVTVGDDSRAVMWDASSGAKLAELKDQQRGLVYVEYSDNGQWFATSAKDDTVRIRAASDGKPIATLKVPGKTFLAAAAFSPDGRWILTMNEGDPPRLWDWQRTPGNSVAELGEEAQSVLAANFSSDSKLLVTAGPGSTAGIWDVVTGRKLHVLGHDGVVTDAVFDPGGRWIVTTSDDSSSAILWDVTTGTRFLDLGGYDSPRETAAFGGPRPYIATGTGEGMVLVYDCDVCGTTSDLEALARERVTRALTAEEKKRYLGQP